jgi:hypothetical protein
MDRFNKELYHIRGRPDWATVGFSGSAQVYFGHVEVLLLGGAAVHRCDPGS